MKNRVVSFFIASILTVSSIGYASFDILPAYALDDESTEVQEEAEDDDEPVEEESAESEDAAESYSESEPADVKIISFDDLPEDVAYQEVKAGTALDEIIFPDTLRIDVVPDPDRQERLIRELGKERQDREAPEEDEGADLLVPSEKGAEKGAAGEEKDAASEGDSESDEDEIIFFDSDTGEASVGVIGDGDEGEDSSYESEEAGSQEDKSEDTHSSSDKETKVPENAMSPEKTDDNRDDVTPGMTDEAEKDESSDDAGSDGLIGRIKSAFGELKVYAAEDSADSDNAGSKAHTEITDKDAEAADTEISHTEDKQSDSGNNASSDYTNSLDDDSNGDSNADLDDARDDIEVSHEMVSGIKWILDPLSNTTDTYDPDLVGHEYVFIPVLLIPDFYYIEAELPTVTVRILEDNYAFDETVEVDGVRIRVRAEEGVFPEGSALSAKKLEEEDEQTVQEAVMDSTEEQGFVVRSYSFDIKVLDEDEKEIQPNTEKGKVIISFETEEAENEELVADIYHVMEDDSAESVADDKTTDGTTEDAAGDDTEDAAKYDTENSADGAAKLTSNTSGEIEVEKLMSVIVDGEETKAVEAVTDGFSKYMLVFTCDEFDIEWPSDKAYVCLDDVFFNNGYLLGNLVIEDPEKDIVYSSSSDSKYFYFERLESVLSSDDDGNAVHDPVVSNGCFAASDEDTAAWYMILKKPFEGQTKKVKLTCSRDETQSTVNINIKCGGIVDAELVHEYPYGLDPEAIAGDDTPDFALQVKTVCANEGGAGVLYQWQYRKSGSKEWKDIDLAHSNVFGGIFEDAPYAAGDWFRCLVNGTATREVQIINASSDSKRVWTDPYNDDSDRCYISNGTVAYTIDTSSGSTVVDVVGEFAKGGKAYMIQTTNGGRGWTIITGTDAAPTQGAFATDTADLDDLYLGFSDEDALKICVEADLGDEEHSLAIGTDCAIGSGEIKDIVPLTGTLIGNVDAQKSITKVSYIGIGSRDAAQTAMNNDKGKEYPAISVVPVSTHGLRVWIDSDTTPEPYKFADGTATVKVDGQAFANVKLLSENKSAGEALSWLDAQAGSTVKFNFEVGSLATATSFKNVKAAKYEYTAKSSNIKNGRLVGEELKKYAITVADPMDSVLETLKIKTPSSVNSSLSSKARATSSGSSATTSTTNSYKADFLDISILQTSDNEAYNNKTVTEVRKDSKDRSSAAMPLKIELSYDFSGKDAIKIFREHNGTVEELTEKSGGADGTYTLNEDDGKIYVYSYKFSQFAVAYKQEVFYTVTFDDGTSKNTVKVKAGEKVTKPADPTREGYIFKGWYTKNSTLSSSTTTSSATSASVFNFDTAITKDITLVAGWTATKDNKKGNGEDSENDSRAPKMGDNIHAVWLWVLILAAGAVTFALALRELRDVKKPHSDKEKSPSKLKRALLILGIIVITTAKFFARKIRENRVKVLLAAGGAAVIVSVLALVSTMLQYKVSEDLYDGAEEIYVEESAEEIPDNLEEKTADNTPKEAEHGWWDCVDVNVRQLSEDYPDVVGWIYFENEDISYPIMYSGDNEKYLRTAYTGEKARAGSIFVDGESTPDFSDPHSLIYGHNMRDRSMFGKLRNYRNEPDYYEDHQYFQVFTRDSVYRYRIFACDVVPDNHDVFWAFGKEPANYWKMLKEVERDSFINTGIEANESDHVITLATCTENDEERLIVCAVRTDEYNYQQ
ncbi:class B sortase [Butyrivibrio sp. NC2007]|uniref:class B sortase n=1 Tax=Butyrivibrio sp. NC2007 TaxID=1280683 RepID=UPI0003B5F96A|nr:class B sortase [Butyrivibrio sp. NC2007]